jgi:hypothetical protein
VDVDLDRDAAVTLGAYWLPPTSAKFGRAGNPTSHYLYCLTDKRSARTEQFRDPNKPTNDDKSMIVEMLSPARVEKMAREMQKAFNERQRASEAKAVEKPRELAELDARLDRLRAQLKSGDPDLTPADLAAAIERVEGQRRETEAAQPTAKASAKILSILPKAAALYRKQIADGLDGDARAAAKARILLKDLFGGKIRLKPKGPELWAHWNLAPAALLRAEGTSGSGGGLPTHKLLIPLKDPN